MAGGESVVVPVVRGDHLGKHEKKLEIGWFERLSSHNLMRESFCVIARK